MGWEMELETGSITVNQADEEMWGQRVATAERLENIRKIVAQIFYHDFRQFVLPNGLIIYLTNGLAH